MAAADDAEGVVVSYINFNLENRDAAQSHVIYIIYDVNDVAFVDTKAYYVGPDDISTSNFITPIVVIINGYHRELNTLPIT